MDEPLGKKAAALLQERLILRLADPSTRSLGPGGAADWKPEAYSYLVVNARYEKARVKGRGWHKPEGVRRLGGEGRRL